MVKNIFKIERSMEKLIETPLKKKLEKMENR
jgi:hypothetical protein